MNHRFALPLVVCIALATPSSRLHAADNWPQWRGPNSNGVAAPGEYPVKFSADEGVAWKVDLPGRGMSTPAVWGDRIFVTCGIDGQDAVVAYDFHGQVLWRKELGAERAGKHQNGSGSNPSPVTNGKHVVAYYKSSTLACLDVDGKLLWEKKLNYEPEDLWWDLGNTPVLAGNFVAVAVMNAGDSYLAAFNLADGELAWKTPRKYERPDESDQSYTTPQLVSLDGRDGLVTFGADHLTAHDAATGELLWEQDGFNPKNEAMWRVIASPAVSGGIALTPFGRAKFLAGVRLTDKNAEIVWERGADERDIGSDVPTPVVVGDRGLVLTDRGRVECLKLATGETLWTGELPRGRAKYYASPVLAGDKLYCAREDGLVFVARVADGLELLSENDMGERLIATPAPVRNGLLIRGEKHLFRIGGESAAGQSGG